MRLLSGSVYLLFALVLTSRFSQAATVTLSPEADARILDIPGNFPTVNYATDLLSVYTAPGNVQRTLMRFDLSGIDLLPGERVSSAVLTLVASTGFGRSNGRRMEVYRVTSDWTETGATWLNRVAGLPWSRSGGDYVGRSGWTDLDPYSVTTADPSSGETISWDITSLADEWLEGVSSNQGLLLRSYDGNGLTFVQKETLDTAKRPVLIISTAPGTPRLRVERQSLGQMTLSWRGQNTGFLQENANLGGSGWSDSSAPQAFANGRTEVALSVAAKGRFFRLRAP